MHYANLFILTQSLWGLEFRIESFLNVQISKFEFWTSKRPSNDLLILSYVERIVICCLNSKFYPRFSEAWSLAAQLKFTELANQFLIWIQSKVSTFQINFSQQLNSTNEFVCGRFFKLLRDTHQLEVHLKHMFLIQILKKEELNRQCAEPRANPTKQANPTK